MDNMVASSVVDVGFETWSYHTKDYEIGIAASQLNTQHYIKLYEEF